MAKAAQWMESRLAAGPYGVPFSFIFGSLPSRELLPTWNSERSMRDLDADRSERKIVWKDPATDLLVQLTAVIYRDFPALEWVIHFKNAGNADTPILEQVLALDADFGPFPSDGPFQLHFAEGSHEKITDFQPMEKSLGPGDRFKLSSFGGRSSDGALPFFNLATAGGGGVVVGIGWTGQWAATFARPGNGGVRAQAGMELTHLALHPGEEIRTPAALMIFWQDTDRLRGQNLLRRLLLRHYTPTIDGKPVEPPSAASPHAVVPFESTTADNMIRAIRNIASHGLPFDTWWIDTGWFPCERNWARYVGNPDPDPARFPHGLRPVADAAAEAGMKFLLWFEPERVMPGTWLHENHPEWLLLPAGEMPAGLRYQINDGFHLLDLGNPQALAWIKAKLSAMIGRERIACYRNDFNMYPLYYWRNLETADRQGIREIRYVTGLYELFDALRREHPHLLIDNCASGGRRIDFEMLRRALVLTRSDYLWDPAGQQCHTYGLSQWLPITGIGAASLDAYSCRSGLGAHYSLAADYFSEDPAVWQAIARVLHEHRSLKHLYTGDFYPLGSYSIQGDAWMAWQYHRPDLGEGLVQAFRRPQSETASATYRLSGLDPSADHELWDLDGKDSRTISGKILTEQGLTIHLPSRPGAAVIQYRRVAR